MKRTIGKWLLLIGLLAYAVFMAAWAASEVRSRSCKGLRIEVQPSADGMPAILTPKAVERELGLLPSRAAGMPLTSLNTEALEKHLRTVNNFEDAECVITSDGYLLVRVTPIVPEARIFTPSGTYYINKEGKRLDAHSEYFIDLPVVSGDFNSRMPARLALPVVRKIASDSLMRSLVSMIEYRSPNNILLIPRIRGHVINIGDTSRLDEKLANLTLFYRKVMPQKGWGAYDTISVKYRGQIVATRADKQRRKHSTDFDDPDPDPEEAIALQQTEPIADLPEPAPAADTPAPEPATKPSPKNP
ncbi:MAG: hypothetical protein HDS66_08745 [Bacteroidales bacterium]|nr:hypothetical protein [Bacteroidales bacterium]